VRRLARLLRVLVLGWLGWRLLGPEIPPRFHGVQRRPLDVTGRTVTVGAYEFFVRELGPPDAEPLVLVHGWSFDGEMTYFRVIEHLARHFRVIVPDLRNHGKSDRIRSRFEIEDLADDLAGVLDAVGVRRPVVMVGYSMGGMAAQAFVRRHPGRVRRLVLAATAAHPIDRHRAIVRISFWLGRAGARISKKESATFTYRLLARSGVLEPEYGRWLWEHLMDRDPTLYYEAGAAVWRFDSRPWVGSLACPTMVVVTTDDRLVPPRNQYELLSLLPEASAHEVLGAGHEAILTRPEEFIDLIETFAGVSA